MCSTSNIKKNLALDVVLKEVIISFQAIISLYNAQPTQITDRKIKIRNYDIM